MTGNLFVYGELCKPPVLRELLGRVPPAEPARLAGFHRCLNPETGYFCAVEKADSVMIGLLLEGIDPSEIALLDGFENVDGGEYRRVEVRATALVLGREVSAWLYIGA